jgi:hypothetical protein
MVLSRFSINVVLGSSARPSRRRSTSLDCFFGGGKPSAFGETPSGVISRGLFIEPPKLEVEALIVRRDQYFAMC